MATHGTLTVEERVRFVAACEGMEESWHFSIDVGGTFTDCIVRRADGATRTHKLLSSGVYKGEAGSGSSALVLHDSRRALDPSGFFNGWLLRVLDASGAVSDEVRVTQHNAGELHLAQSLSYSLGEGVRYELRSDLEAPVLGVRWLLGLRPDQDAPPCRVRLGTTRATNALLERQGAPTAFVTTRGFGDALLIGTGNRPRLFDLRVRRPAMLYTHAVELAERMDATGAVVLPLKDHEVRRALEPLREAGIVSLAVCLLHAARNDSHEQFVERVARAMGFAQISLSSGLSPLPGFIARAETTVIDAYLSPILSDYCQRVQDQLPHAQLRWMTSAGALTPTENFSGRAAILSGPCGGVVGLAHVARESGEARVVGFDMGGTSSDVSRWDGEFERRYEMEVRDPDSGGTLRVVAPLLRVETVAAGGGSICSFDGQALRVGPRSAGSDPGPACYGRGGPLCVTDLNVYAGRLLPHHFPFPLDRAALTARLDELRTHIREAIGLNYDRDALVLGLLRIANANMSAPIREASLGRGFDPRTHTLVPFGGAGAQHACEIARELGMTRILCHPSAGVLSALGIGVAPQSRFAERALMCPCDDAALEFVRSLCAEIETDLRVVLEREGVARPAISPPSIGLELRYAGQETRLSVPYALQDDATTVRSHFEERHRALYGFDFPSRAIEIYAVRMELASQEESLLPIAPVNKARLLTPTATVPMLSEAGWGEAALYEREELQPGDHFVGPAIVPETSSTIVVATGWRVQVNAAGALLLERKDAAEVVSAIPEAEGMKHDAAPDPVELELFNNAFASIAAQMGTLLQKTALSTNVKERLDFSCGIFDARGDLVVNAPHIPVHLGAMSECVKCLLQDARAMRFGDVWVSNDPFRGGSHLPDVTVVSPVFVDGLDAPQFYVAARAHHAEIGGMSPGSMPPFSHTLAEEGIVIRTFCLVRDGVSHESELRDLLTSGPYPSRSVEENIADLNAQVAANQLGARLLRDLCGQRGAATVATYMRQVRVAAETKMRRALGNLEAGERRFEDALDDGTPLCVTLTVSHDERGGNATLDFAGTGPVLASNLNANRAIVTSCVLYCLRCLLNEEIPLNAGVLAPVEIVIPQGCFLNPSVGDDPTTTPAVVGGNVETSQRIVDVILGALGIVAASQGTMNNFLFGRSGEGAFGFYETIGGGTGAGPFFAGASAVHSHMTNTRLTDPEILEARYPVRLQEMSVRRGSGGAGQQRGGDGMVRHWEFLAPLEVSLLTSRRTTQPYGAQGGASGAAGHNLLQRAGEERFQELPSATLIEVEKGDQIRLETPGGGGWGTPHAT